MRAQKKKILNGGIETRADIVSAKRVVVKVGSRVIVQRTGRPELRRMRALVNDLAWFNEAGGELCVVSSGAIGAGMEALGISHYPGNLPDLQMSAAVGQIRLMSRYSDLFGAKQCKIGQVLLTRDGLNDRTRHLNARNTLMNMLRQSIIPIVNENDTVAPDEIRMGDNDVLAALVALLVDADLLVLMSTTDGLREPSSAGRTRRVRQVEEITPEVLQLATGKGSSISSGGMATKLQAAATAARSGVACVIADGRKPGMLKKVLRGEDAGTFIGVSAAGCGRVSGRKKWIAFFNRASGSLVIDDGARCALLEKGRSLLPIGIKSVDGSFPAGAMVNIHRSDGKTIARGLAEYSSDEIEKIRGRKTSEIAGVLGRKDFDEVIHRDNLVIL